MNKNEDRKKDKGNSGKGFREKWIYLEEISIENKWMTPYTETPYSFRKRGQFSTGINNNSFS